MKKLIIAFAFLTITGMQAQEIAEVKTKNLASYGMKKFKDAKKKIFIQHFFVNYQMLFDQIEIAKGGREAGGGVRGRAKAQLVLGVKGISETDLQNITDKLYENYKSKLEQAGYQIITSQDVANNEYFKGWQQLSGGTPSKAQFPGYVSTAPTNFIFLAKKISKKGKVKSNRGIFDNGMGTSKNLGGIIIARVNIAVPFMKDAESQGSRALTKTFGGVAKIVARPNLSIAERTSFSTKGSFAQKTITLTTNSLFAYKEGLKKQATLNVIPKKGIEIKGVFENKKYKAVKSAQQDLWGTGYGAIRIFSASEQVLKKMQAIPCDPETYKNGVLQAGEKFLNASLAEFLKYK